MATTTTKPNNELMPLSEMPRVKAAMAKRQPVLEEKLRTETLLSQYRSALTPAIAIEQNPSPDVVWMARSNISAVEKRYHELLVELAEADRVLEAARELDKAELLRRFEERERVEIAAMWEGFEAVIAPNARQAALEQQKHEMLGVYLDPKHWPQLLPSTRERTSFFDEWKQRIAGKPQRGVWSESAALNDESS